MVALNIIKAVGLLNLASVTLAGVVPKSGLVARSCDPEPPRVADTADAKGQLINNATSIFAWQFSAVISGVGSDASSLSNVIPGQPSTTTHIKLLVDNANAIGANGDVLARMLPYRIGCGINGDDHILKYARLVFMTELDMIFPHRWTGFTILCDNWDHSRLQTVYKTKEHADALYNWVCAGSNTGKPTKQMTPTPVPETDIDDFVSSLSSIFTWELLGILMNSEQVKTACTKDWDAFSANIKKIGLKPSVIQSQLCTADNQKTLPNSVVTVDNIETQIKLIATHLLLVQLFALSNEDDYKNFLCVTDSYKLGNIYILGLDGAAFFAGMRDRCARMGL